MKGRFFVNMCRRTHLLLLGSELSVSLGVNLAGEGLFELEGNGVHERDKGGDEQTRGLGVPQRRRQETQRGAVVHGVVGHVEGEARDPLVHENAKVVAQVGACDAQSVHGGEHQHVAHTKQHHGQGLDDVGVGDGQQDGGGLLLKSLVVQVVSEDAQREDGDGQQVASRLGSSGDLGQKVRVVLGPSDNVPEDGVERDGSENDWVSRGEGEGDIESVTGELAKKHDKNQAIAANGDTVES